MREDFHDVRKQGFALFLDEFAADPGERLAVPAFQVSNRHAGRVRRRASAYPRRRRSFSRLPQDHALLDGAGGGAIRESRQLSRFVTL